MMLYIGKFLHMTNQQKAKESERRHGEFNLIVEAENDEAAVERFKERIVNSRENSDLFEGDSSIYIVHLLELEEFPSDRARVLYYKSIAGDPIMPYISCSTPDGESDGCRILNWMKNRPEIDGEDANLFIEFKD
ncbi:MAG: hypothetical protein OET63_14885 [Desulfobacterales bacterium]|nr:hypothetical protein [Desulfobacterales bacterium]